jgi:hypothetical protein
MNDMSAIGKLMNLARIALSGNPGVWFLVNISFDATCTMDFFSSHERKSKMGPSVVYRSDPAQKLALASTYENDAAIYRAST